MTKLEIIEETANYYNINNWAGGPRLGQGLGVCFYTNFDNTKQCAVGRCLKNPTGLNGTIKSLMDSKKIQNEDFKPEYQNHDVDFWIDLQVFHDAKYNWTLTGISEEGLEYKKQLIEKYKNN